LLDFPCGQDDEDEPASVKSTSALTGVQVNALLGIINQVSTGALKKETAQQVIVTSFPLTLAQAEKMLEDIDISEPEMPTGPEQEPQGEEIDDDEGETTPEGETVIGAGLISASAFSRALKRVDFAVIGKTSENQVDADTRQISRHVASMVDTMDITPTLDVNKLKFDSKMVTKLRKMVQGSMKDAWGTGTRHASIEVDKAKGESFSIDRKRMKFIEEEYFDIKSFAVAGTLTNDALALIKQTILTGVKQGATTKDIIANIYSALITEGYTTANDVEAVLGAALVSDLEIAKGVNVNKAHRIETMVRTNIFEAINEARYNYFSDPGLEGFVEALEYSAILDKRTTTICLHLDGHVHPTDSDEWNKYRPPNHFNCRSLLIPVTEIDTWSESDLPTQDPQKGF
jgi:SPP1 gp7 family putative phage head morphogenesis protein